MIVAFSCGNLKATFGSIFATLSPGFGVDCDVFLQTEASSRGYNYFELLQFKKTLLWLR